MTDATTPSPELDTDPPEYKFNVGDRLSIPCHGGKYIASVVKRYPNLEVACDEYERSFRTILQSPFGKAKPDQPFYYCQVDNSTHKPIGVAEQHATLKWAQPIEKEAKA